MPRNLGVDAQQCLAALDALADRGQQISQPVRIDRLLDVVERAGFDGFHGARDGGRGAREDHVRLRVEDFDLPQHAEAVHFGPPHIHDRSIRPHRRQQGERRGGVRLLDDVHAELGRETLHQIDDGRILVHDEQDRHSAWG